MGPILPTLSSFGYQAIVLSTMGGPGGLTHRRACLAHALSDSDKVKLRCEDGFRLTASARQVGASGRTWNFKMMAQYPRIENGGAKGSTILGILEVQVLRPYIVDFPDLATSCHAWEASGSRVIITPANQNPSKNQRRRLLDPKTIKQPASPTAL